MCTGLVAAPMVGREVAKVVAATAAGREAAMAVAVTAEVQD